MIKHKQFTNNFNAYAVGKAKTPIYIFFVLIPFFIFYGCGFSTDYVGKHTFYRYSSEKYNIEGVKSGYYNIFSTSEINIRKEGGGFKGSIVDNGGSNSFELTDIQLENDTLKFNLGAWGRCFLVKKDGKEFFIRKKNTNTDKTQKGNPLLVDNEKYFILRRPVEGEKLNELEASMLETTSLVDLKKEETESQKELDELKSKFKTDSSYKRVKDMEETQLKGIKAKISFIENRILELRKQ